MLLLITFLQQKVRLLPLGGMLYKHNEVLLRNYKDMISLLLLNCFFAFTFEAMHVRQLKFQIKVE